MVPAPTPAAPDDDQPRIDWTGRRPLGSSDDRTGEPPSDGTAGASGPRRLFVLAGVVSVAYIAWVVIDLLVLSISGPAYLTLHDALGSLAARVVLSLVWLAVLYHGLEGLRVVFGELVPGLQARDRATRAVVAFVLFTAWIPTALVIVWPAVRRWFAA